MTESSRTTDRVPRTLRSAGALLALFALLLPSFVRASLAIEPAFIELKLDRGRPSEVITVMNTTDFETRYRAQIVHFVYTKDGNFKMLEPDEQSLAGWVKFNPREFTLAPKESRAIRVTVIPPGNLEDGEYWAALRFEPLVGIVSRAEDGEGRSVALEVRANILVPIVGQVGKMTHHCDLVDLKAWRHEGGVAIVAFLANTGSARVRVKGSYEILDAAGNALGEGLIGEDTILAGGERVFARAVEADLPQGECSVRVRYASEKLEEALAGQTRIRDEAPEGGPGDTPAG